MKETITVRDSHLIDGGISKGRHGARKVPHILQQRKWHGGQIPG